MSKYHLYDRYAAEIAAGIPADDELLSMAQVAALLRCSPQTFMSSRCREVNYSGPPFVKIGAEVRKHVRWIKRARRNAEKLLGGIAENFDRCLHDELAAFREDHADEERERNADPRGYVFSARFIKCLREAQLTDEDIADRFSVWSEAVGKTLAEIAALCAGLKGGAFEFDTLLRSAKDEIADLIRLDTPPNGEEHLTEHLAFDPSFFMASPDEVGAVLEFFDGR